MPNKVPQILYVISDGCMHNKQVLIITHTHQQDKSRFSPPVGRGADRVQAGTSTDAALHHQDRRRGRCKTKNMRRDSLARHARNGSATLETAL